MIILALRLNTSQVTTQDLIHAPERIRRQAKLSTRREGKMFFLENDKEILKKSPPSQQERKRLQYITFLNELFTYQYLTEL